MNCSAATIAISACKPDIGGGNFPAGRAHARAVLGRKNSKRREGLKRGLRSLDKVDRLERYLDVFRLAARGSIGGALSSPDLLPATARARCGNKCWADLEPGIRDLGEAVVRFQLHRNRLLAAGRVVDVARTKFPCATALEIRVPCLDEEIIGIFSSNFLTTIRCMA